MQATFGEKELKNLLEKIRIFNHYIGEYELFAITEHFDYVVKLDNGTLPIRITDLIANRENKLSPGMLQVMADRFRPIEGKVKTELISEPIIKEFEPRKKQTKSELRLVFTLVFTGLLVMAFVWFGTSDNSLPEKKSKASHVNTQNTYKAKVQSVEEMEKASPARFLNVKGEFRKTLFGNKIKLQLEVVNKATVTSYKDVVIEVQYYSKSKTLLAQKDFTLYDVFLPAAEKAVKLKIDNIKDTETVKWSVKSAVSFRP